MDTMYPAKINSPATTLSSGINNVVTTIPLTDASVVPAAPNLAVIGTGEDAETVAYTGKSGNDLTGCTRGFQGTAKAWDSGTSVARFFTAYDYDTLRTNVSGLELNPKARAYRNGDWYVNESGLWIRVPLNAETYDQENSFDTTSKTGTADEDKTDALVDDASSQFTSADVGKWVRNTVDHTHAIVTAFVDAGELTLDEDIFPDGIDTYELYSSSFTAPEAGYYSIVGVVRNNWTTADKWYFAGLSKNGTWLATGGWQASVGDGVAGNCISGVIVDFAYLAADDYINLLLYHNEGDTAKFRGEQSQTFMAVHKLSKGA